MSDERLRIPATRALLEGWCGPVLERGTRVIACGITPKGLCDVAVPSTGRFGCVPIALISLDASHAEVRDRVCRVLAATLYTDGPHSSACVVPGRRGLGGAPGLLFGLLTVTPEDGDRWRWFDDDRAPALAALDPNDDTRLPDGSRLVDALALAAVAREVTRG